MTNTALKSTETTNEVPNWVRVHAAISKGLFRSCPKGSEGARPEAREELAKAGIELSDALRRSR